MAAAITVAFGEGAEAVIQCGDIIGGNTLRASLKLGIPIHAIHGNNLGDCVTTMLKLQADHHGTRSAALPAGATKQDPGSSDDENYLPPIVI